MGTYTTIYNLFMPTVGEQGWGELVNGNFTTIDTTMAGLNTRLTAVENEVNGNLNCTSITTSGKVTANGGVGTTSLTTSGTITSTGKITANGGVGTTSLTTSSTIVSTGLITANGGVQGFLFIKGTLQTSSADATYASKGAINIDGSTCINPIYEAATWNTEYPYTLNVPICSKPNYFKASPGVYVKAADASGTIASNRTVTIANAYNGNMELGYKLTSASSYTEVTIANKSSITLNMVGTYHIWCRFAANNNYNGALRYITITCPAQTYYIRYATP